MLPIGLPRLRNGVVSNPVLHSKSFKCSTDCEQGLGLVMIGPIYKAHCAVTSK